MSNDVTFAHSEYETTSSTDIQSMLDDIASNGGGVLNLPAGTYTLTADLVIPSSVQLVGAGPTSTIINGDGSYNISSNGSATYSTGTLTVISGVNVTGSGTSWLGNVTAGQQIFIGTRWYLIAAVTSDTTLILAESYGDNVVLPCTYVTATIITDILFQDLAVTGCPSYAFNMQYVRRLIFERVQIFLNGSGIALTFCSEITGRTSDSVASTSGPGINMDSCGLGLFQTFAFASNAGDGMIISNVKDFAFNQCACDGNGGYGATIDTGVNLQLYIDASGNTSDGIKLATNCDGVRIYNTDTIGNSTYGINISDASDTNTIIYGSRSSFNGTADYQDLGTGTTKGVNIGF